MITTLDNFDAGLTWWCKKNWAKDFLNEEYAEIYAARAEGITIEWWEATVGRLGQWRAYRGPTTPNTKAEIRARGLERLAHRTHLLQRDQPSSKHRDGWRHDARAQSVIER